LALLFDARAGPFFHFPKFFAAKWLPTKSAPMLCVPLVRAWEGNFLRRHGEDLLPMIDTWYQSDISDNTVYSGRLSRALGAITARSIIMPSTTDLYFTLADSEAETGLMPNAELRPISSIWGHRAGNPVQCPEDEATLSTAVRGLLSG
jgi:homoserine O-acetyltransferase/O-succinyltransferase